MHKLSYFDLSAAILAFCIGADARGTELEGALQYPPPSIGEDAQPPPPARAVRQPVSPRRIEWASAGQAHRPARNCFLPALRSQDLEHRRRPKADVSNGTVI